MQGAFILSLVHLAIIMLALKFFQGAFGFRQFKSTGPRIRCVRRQLSETMSRNFLDIPFESKDEVKTLGAKWDSEAKKWYIPDGVDPSPFDKFSKVYLSVPFDEKDTVKALGARWDKEKMKWFVPAGKSTTAFTKWLTSKGNYTPKKSSTSRNVAEAITAGKDFSTSKVPSKPKVIEEDPSKLIVLLSVDTNGLPLQNKGVYLPYDNLNAFDSSRLIQISYQLCRLRDMQALSVGSYTIKSDGFSIDNSEYHNITLEVSRKEGVPFPAAAEKVFAEIRKADFLMAHNAEFVFSVLSSELFRHGMLDLLSTFDSRVKRCSMELAAPLLGLKDIRGEVKKPSLKELVQATSGEQIPNVRNSSANVEYLRKAMQILVNTDRLQIKA